MRLLLCIHSDQDRMKIILSLLLLAQTVTLGSTKRYCDGQWVDLSSIESPFMNYTVVCANSDFWLCWTLL